MFTKIGTITIGVSDAYVSLVLIWSPQYDVSEFNPGPLPRRSMELEAFLRKPLCKERNR